MLTASQTIQRLIEGRELFFDEMLGVMRAIMHGEFTPVQVASIVTGLRCKGETVQEVAAAATVMRELATPVPVQNRQQLVDTCGTGGDGAHTFNISTTSAFVVAAAGARVAKHGGRSVSSQCGSADVLEALGVNLALTPSQVGQAIDTLGIGFMFAPNHHQAMRHAAPIRRELGVRTIFNILGPLTNPAGAPNQVIGVFHRDLVGIQARVLQMLGSHHVMAVHGEDGLDEITLTGKTAVAEVRDGWVREYEIDPRDYGFAYCDAADLYAANTAEAAACLQAVLANTPGPARDIVCLNAGAAIYVAGCVPNLAAGIEQAKNMLSSGAAAQKFAAYRNWTQQQTEHVVS